MEENHESKSTVGKNSVNEYSTALLNTNLNKRRKEGKLCDIVIKINDMEYSAHKIILSAFSPYFEAMFCGNFTEAEKSIVSLSNIDGNIMEIILDYAYTASIEITTSNVQPILHAANFLQAGPLFERCCHFLENALAFDNCVGIWNVAEAYSCSFLKKSSGKYILDHFTKVSAECEFLELEPGRLIEIISNDSLIVEKEDVVLNAVIQWFHYKEGQRAGALKDVLSQVRLAHVDPYYLYDRVKAVLAIRDSPECMNLIEEAQKYMFLPNRRFDFQSSITRRRSNSSHVEALIVFWVYPGRTFDTAITITEDLQFVNLFIYRDHWTFETYAVYCSNFEMLALADDYKHIFQYDVITDDWVEIPRLVVNDNVAVAHLDDYWYVFGGSLPSDRPVEPNVKKAKTDVDVRRNVHRYDPSKKAWTAVARLPEPFTKPAVVTVGGMLYVIGAEGKKEKEETVVKVQRYDPRTDVWTEETSLRSQLDSPRACAMNSRIYVCSPATKREVNVFDCTTTKWHRCSDMINSFVEGLVILNGRILVLSERADGQRVIERYSPVADSWQEFVFFTRSPLTDIAGPLLFSRDMVFEEPHGEITLLV